MRKSGPILLVLVSLLLLSSFMGYETLVYEWDFGDESPTSSDRNPTHIYTSPGTYNWSMTVSLNGDECLKTGQIEISTTSTTEIGLNRNQLNFGSSNGITTSDQKIIINNLGTGSLNWHLEENASWLNCTPQSGVGSGAFMVSVNPSGLSYGTYNHSIQVIDSLAINSPQVVNVSFNVKAPNNTQPPIGFWDTPVSGATQVRGQIPVTGWALDDIEIDRVEIWRRAEPEDPPEAINSEGLAPVGTALFVEGARPNLETDFPYNLYPFNYTGGWGYMLLTYGLVRRGNGTYVLHAFVWDVEGKRTHLGTKTITCDNANAVKPFGTIDTPGPGMVFPHSLYGNINFGWVLTPQPKHIPFDGSSIYVYIDGALKGNLAEYGNYSASVAAMFPGYANTNNSYGHYFIDLAAYETGVHNIQWTAYDSNGVGEGIGSRYFNIDNTGSAVGDLQAGIQRTNIFHAYSDLFSMQENLASPVGLKTGYSLHSNAKDVYPDAQGIVEIEIKELERIELSLSDISSDYCGYLVVGNKLRPLPVGSTLDTKTGIFYWQPGAGFLGDYKLVFVDRYQKTFKCVNINILPKIQPVAALPSKTPRVRENTSDLSFQALNALECAATVPANGLVGEIIQFQGTVTSTDNEISITLSPVAGGVDTVVSATIAIKNSANVISAFGMDVNFDPAAFTYVGYSHGTLTSSWGSGILAHDAGGGVVKAGGWGGGNSIPYDSTGSIIEIRFRVTGGSGSRTISISDFTDDIVGMSPSPGSATFNIQ